MNVKPLRSVRAKLLAGLLIPILLFVAVDTISLYHSALASAHKAYDRQLVAAAHSIGDMLRLERGLLQITVPYAVLELNRPESGTAMIYRVNGLDGELLWGDADLPRYAGDVPASSSYASLVATVDEHVHGQAVRMVVLYQPVDGHDRSGLVTIQVAEPLVNRERMARDTLLRTLMLQSLLVLGVIAVIYWVVTQALKPLSALSRQLDAREAGDLSPLKDDQATAELQPVIAAMNHLMQKLKHLLGQQQRFVADAAHQLRTPLAVLNTQLQSGLRGDVPPLALMEEMQSTVRRATALSNKMLSLVKVEQLVDRGEMRECTIHDLVQEAALELSPLISEKHQDFELSATPPARDTKILANPWLLSELLRNLMHNAVRYTPTGGALGVHLSVDRLSLWITCWDTGPGVATELHEQIFEPFSTADAAKRDPGSSGLGLSICKAIVQSMQGQISLRPHHSDAQPPGLEVTVQLPVTPTAAQLHR